MRTELGTPPASRRDRLPIPKEPLPSVNIFSLIKDWIGKDLHKLALPTHLNEPLTDLQRRAALLPPKSVERLLHVCAFAISTYNTVKRNEKPFKNLQNSTFELIYPEKGIRAIGEKVCHIPITVAVHIEGRGWDYNANDWFHMSLRPNSAFFRPVGEFCLKFHDGDEYAWTGVNACLHNIVVGSPYVDHGGLFYVSGLDSGDTLRGAINHSLFRRSTNQVSVFLERQGQKVEGVGMWGAWNDEIWAAFPDGTKTCLWSAAPLHLTSSKFLFPEWALHLNELTPELMTKLPPTDDRLRPDMRLMEHGYYLAANREKERLEEKQRQERNAAEAAGEPWQPRWFKKVPGGLRGFEKYMYKGGYWEARESGNWEGVRDIYDPGPKSAYGSEQPAELLL
ncbi:hypothetical protein WJX75_008061 [Coccomyxa subellipsoidea]|uniref:Oxysterol-binding protein n=1 Tax=Coccomyxa subellipsoidea TaxID=248742 RepID=A0ABR2YYZ9_9CHLO